MAFPVTLSNVPLEFDALPALKALHWLGAGDRRIYSMARLYVHGDDLCISLSAFEQQPHPASRLAFAFGSAEGQSLLLLVLSPSACSLLRCGKTPAPALWGKPLGEEIYAPVPARFSGNDEQGWYWGAHITLPAEELNKAGFAVPLGQSFQGGLLKFGAYGQGCGASYPLDEELSPLEFSLFSPFEVVNY